MEAKNKGPSKPAAEQQPEDLAAVIRGISRGMERLLRSGLNRKAIIVLLSAETGETRTRCAVMLGALEQLEQRYTTKGG